MKAGAGDPARERLEIVPCDQIGLPVRGGDVGKPRVLFVGQDRGLQQVVDHCNRFAESTMANHDRETVLVEQAVELNL